MTTDSLLSFSRTNASPDEAPSGGDSARPARMRALGQRRYGSADNLRIEELPVPEPAEDEVLVRVHAAAVCRGDVHLMTGRPYLVRAVFGLRALREPVLGQEMAGTVVAVGREVRSFAVGDRVFGPVGKGCFADFVRAPADRLCAVPEGVDFETAAAVGDSAMTALQALRDVGGLRSGQRVLINGAAGGVGSFAVQIARAMGAELTAVCSTRNVERVRALGANRVVDYTREDFVESATSPYDLVVDFVGNRSLRAYRRILAPRGVFVSCAASPGADWIGPLWWMAKVQLFQLLGRRAWKLFLVQFRSDDLRHLQQMLRDGRLRPVVERVLPLERGAEALREVQAGHVQGKTVLRLRP